MLDSIQLLPALWGIRGVQEIINVHPLFVHFPIALLLTSLAFYVFGTLFRNDGLLAAGKWSLLAGTLFAAETVWTGLIAEESVPHGGGIHDTMMLHKYIGFTVLGLGVVLSAWVLFSKAHIPAKGKPLFLIALAVLGLILIQGADLGGRMVFLNGVGVGRKSMLPQELTGGHGTHEHGGKEHAGHDHGEHAH